MLNLTVRKITKTALYVVVSTSKVKTDLLANCWNCTPKRIYFKLLQCVLQNLSEQDLDEVVTGLVCSLLEGFRTGLGSLGQVLLPLGVLFGRLIGEKCKIDFFMFCFAARTVGYLMKHYIYKYIYILTQNAVPYLKEKVKEVDRRVEKNKFPGFLSCTANKTLKVPKFCASCCAVTLPFS